MEENVEQEFNASLAMALHRSEEDIIIDVVGFGGEKTDNMASSSVSSPPPAAAAAAAVTPSSTNESITTTTAASDLPCLPEEENDRTDKEEKKDDTPNKTQKRRGGFSSFIPCRPEPYLQDKIYSESISSNTTCGHDPAGKPTNRSIIGNYEDDSFSSSILSLFPQYTEVKELIQKEKKKEDILKQRRIEVNANIIAMRGEQQQQQSVTFAKTTRGKRIKSGSLEAMLNASINPRVRQIMLERELWASGSGSHFVPTLSTSPTPSPRSMIPLAAAVDGEKEGGNGGDSNNISNRNEEKGTPEGKNI
eukprot:988680-Ditylum_brightwellii.AAC.1